MATNPIPFLLAAVARSTAEGGRRRVGTIPAKFVVISSACLLALGASMGTVRSGAAVANHAKLRPIRIGIVSFLTGPAAAPFGVPARNGAALLIQKLNARSVPTPYHARGFGGHRLQVVYLDENGSPDQNVANYRRLVQSQKVDLVIGYISSEDCLAVEPVVEQLKKFTVFFDCGTSELFQHPHHYLFRTAGDQATDAIAAARYILAVKGKVKSIAGINQNYAWGQDNWETFSTAMKRLDPSVQVKDALFPTIFSGQYSSEISKLLVDRPEVIYSSFWGGDLDSLLTQAVPRGLTHESLVVMNAADTALPRLGRSFPAGIAVGARGPHGTLAPHNRLNRWLIKAYRTRYHTAPVYPVWHIAQALLGVKAAYEKAMRLHHTNSPSQAQVMSALSGLNFATPSGSIAMDLVGGHQASEGNAYGISAGFDASTGEVRLKDVKRYSPRCVDPPNGVTVARWIASGFRGARC